MLVAPPRQEQLKLAHVLDAGALRALQNLVRAEAYSQTIYLCELGHVCPSPYASHGLEAP